MWRALCIMYIMYIGVYMYNCMYRCYTYVDVWLIRLITLTCVNCCREIEMIYLISERWCLIVTSDKISYIFVMWIFGLQRLSELLVWIIPVVLFVISKCTSRLWWWLVSRVTICQFVTLCVWSPVLVMIWLKLSIMVVIFKEFR